MGVRIGVLHPGEMGAALAECLEREVVWASEARSKASAERAKQAGIVDLGSVESLVNAVDLVISVCPPAQAWEVAVQVGNLGFDGIYVDANAVSPATARHIGNLFDRFVDGGIIGPPPSPGHDATRLYLSGDEAEEVAAEFAASVVDARVIGAEPGRASALKMAYAGWTKGSSALLLSVAALATSEDVIEALLDEWDMSLPELRERLEQVSARVGRKAWRFVGEMEEIARTHGDAGLPDGFHQAAADLYSRVALLKDQPASQSTEEIMRLLLDGRSITETTRHHP
jgi:3-hydroxyisobutyrate dehydrogenase-like beta-hydroxyacid dehydrogenase